MLSLIKCFMEGSYLDNKLPAFINDSIPFRITSSEPLMALSSWAVELQKLEIAICLHAAFKCSEPLRTGIPKAPDLVVLDGTPKGIKQNQ